MDPIKELVNVVKKLADDIAVIKSTIIDSNKTIKDINDNTINNLNDIESAIENIECTCEK